MGARTGVTESLGGGSKWWLNWAAESRRDGGSEVDGAGTGTCADPGEIQTEQVGWLVSPFCPSFLFYISANAHINLKHLFFLLEKIMLRS